MQPTKKSELSVGTLKRLAIETMEKRCGQGIRIFTDGSIKESGIGIGIFNETSKEKLAVGIKENVSIKTAETVAILLAVQIGRKSGSNIVNILTDSKSAGVSIERTNKNGLTRHYENKIIDVIRQQPETKFRIQWIPSHVGIMGNDMADSLANKGAEEPRYSISIKMTISEIRNELKRVEKEQWIRRYECATISKAKKHRTLTQCLIPDKPWFIR